MAESLAYMGWPFVVLLWGLVILAVVLVVRRMDSMIRDRRWIRDARLGILKRRYGPRRFAKSRRSPTGAERLDA